MIFTTLNQHVNEMMTTASKKFKNFWLSRFLIIMQNVNIVTNGKRNSRLDPRLSCAALRWLYRRERLQGGPTVESNSPVAGPPRAVGHSVESGYSVV